MRLLFYVRTFKDQGTGLEGQAVKLCRALAAAGHDIHVLAEDADDFPNIHTYRGFQNAVDLAGKILPHLTIDWEFILPADIHSLGGGTHIGYIPYSLRSYPWYLRWWRALRYRSLRHRKIIARQYTLLSNPDAHFLANSHQTARMAIEAGADPNHVTVRHRPVDLSIFNPERAARLGQEKRNELGIRNDELVLLFCAHNLRLKNFSLAAKLTRKLAAKYPVRLVLVGKRSPNIREPWFIYAGPVSDMAPYYGMADLFIHPTWFDSCANVVIEAMACGRPVLVSDTCGSHELIESGKNGFICSVCESDSEQKWYEQLDQLLADPNLRKKVGQTAAETAQAWSMPNYLTWFQDYLIRVRREKEEREGLDSYLLEEQS